MSGPLPHRTPEQMRITVEAASRARSRRKEIRRALRKREMDWRGLLDLAATEQTVGRMRAWDAIAQMKGYDRPPISWQLEALAIKPRACLSRLGANQKAGLLRLWGRV